MKRAKETLVTGNNPKFLIGDTAIVIITGSKLSSYEDLIINDFQGQKVRIKSLNRRLSNIFYECYLCKETVPYGKAIIREKFLFREKELITDLLLLL